MSNKILIKRGSGAPTTSNLDNYEIAYDTGANKLYIRDGSDIIPFGAIVDEDNFASDDANRAPSQQSTKAYIASELAAAGAGDITAVVAGNGLTGGSTTGSATLDIGAGTGIDVVADAISVDVSDFMSNGSNNRILTATGTDAMNAESNLTFDGTNLDLPDSKKVRFGTDNDLEIYHDGTNDIINTKGNAFKLLDSGQERFTINSAGNIQFNNAQTDANTRFGTTGSLYTLWVDGGTDRIGIGTNSPAYKLDVSGTGRFTGHVDFDSTITIDSVLYGNQIDLTGELNFTGAGNKIIDVETLANSNYLLIRHHNPTGNLFEQALKLTANGSAELFYNNSKKFETTSTGAKITGTTNSDLFSLEGAGSSFKLIAESGSTGSADIMAYRLGLRYGSNDNGFIDFYRGPDGATGYLAFGASGSEAMRLDRFGNLGIGVASPTSKVHIYNGDGSIPDDANNHLLVEDDGHSYIGIGGGTSSDTGIHFMDSGGIRGRIAYKHSSDSMDFKTANAVQMTINSSGDLELANTKKLVLDGPGGNTYLQQNTGSSSRMDVVVNGSGILDIYNTFLRVNGYLDAKDIYVEHGGSDYSPGINFLGGSDTPGSNAYENATIGYYDNSGTGLMRFGINRGAGNFDFRIGGNRSFIATTTYLAVPDNAYLAAGNDNDIFIRHDGNGHLQSNAGTMFINQVSNNSMIFSTSNTERIRVEGGGDVGINCTNPPFQLKVNVTQGTYTSWETIAGFQAKRSADSETEAGIMINSLGDALGGQISSNWYWSNNTGQRANTGRSSGVFGIANSTTTNSEFYWQTTPHNSNTVTTRMELDGATSTLHVDGDVVAYSTTVSDKRLKDNVETIDNALSKVMKLRGVEFDWIGASRKGQHDIGLIAQEVEEVIPEIVREKEFKVGEFTDNKQIFKTIDYEKIVAVLVESTKEQQKQIEDLKKEIKELKK